jgi:iron complex outermembrane recepter protein
MLGRIRRLAATGIVLIACAPPATWAQAAPPVRDRIEVTGSRLVDVDVESASPITTIRAEEIRAAGYESLELVLNNLPQLVADQGSRVSNGASGTATADLRGLLPQRTLILVNGRRLLSGSPFLLAGDLNQIPVQLVSRVEILTGGASAVHGSDAIAGVINIILKDKYEGVEATVSHDFYSHRQKSGRMQALLASSGYAPPEDKRHDGATTSAHLILGANFAGDRGNALVAFRYLESEALLQTERDYSACALTIFDFGLPTQFEGCGGSSTSFPGRFVDATRRRSLTVADASGNVRPWVGARDAFNFAPWNYYQRPIERYGFNAFVHYDVTARTRVYGEFGFHDDKTVAQIAPSGIFGGTWTIRWENPLLSDAWRSNLTFRDPDGTPGTGPGTAASVVIQRRNVEGGGRRFEKHHTSYREVIGLRGELFGPWTYDAHFQAAKVIASEVSSNDFSLTRVGRALDVVRDPATGAPACASAVNGFDRGCVPYDIWSLGRVTPEALAYLQTPAFRRGYTAQSLLSASVRGDLGDHGVRLPWARESVEVAFGIERRADKMDLAADALFASGDLAGAGTSSPPIKGRVTVKEAFAEIRAPILDSLALTGSFRYSDYSTGARANTFGVGFNASPWSALRLRGSFQRAVRAASLAELFEPQVTGFWDLFPEGDPCEGPVPRLPLATCARTGVTAAQYGRIPEEPPGAFFPAVYGGNPRLDPETANTLTLGFAFTPTRAFAATVDWFDFRIDDFISGGDARVLFQRCIDTGDPAFCSLITRDPTLGTLWIAPAALVATNQNIGRVRVSGLDLAASYRIGPFALAAQGTYLRSYTIEQFRGAEGAQCAGHHLGACYTPRPRWRHRLRGTWDGPWNLQLAASWRYFGRLTDPDGEIPDVAPMNYLDLSLAWAFDKRMSLRLGIDNVTDRDPPLVGNAGGGPLNGNTWVQSYDALGRHVSVSLQARF